MTRIAKDMSLRIIGSENELVIKELDALHKQSSAEFNIYDDWLKNFPTPGKVSEENLIKMQIHVNKTIKERATIRNEYFSAGYNVCKTFGAVAQIANLSELSKTVSLSKSCLDFSKNVFEIKDLIALGGADLAKSLADPTLALATIGMEILGSFIGSSGPSFEEAMFIQLQEISKQISELHDQMLRQFIKVHEHLKIIHQSILDCTEGLRVLITTEIQGLRNDSVERLTRIDAKLSTLLRVTTNGQRELLTQDLINLITTANSRILHYKTISERSDVKDVAENLQNNWILNQCAARSITGVSRFINGNNNGSHVADVELLTDDASNMHDILGYLALTANEVYPPVTEGVSINKIMHPDIFGIPVAKYLDLRKVFPTYIADNDTGAEFLRIHEFAEHTTRFISNIQGSEQFFCELFANYQQSIENVQNVIDQQINAANREFRDEFSDQNLNLNISIDALLNLFNAKRIKSCKQIDTHHLSFSETLTLRPELYLAHLFRKGEFKVSFTKQAKSGINPIDFDLAIICHKAWEAQGQINRDKKDSEFMKINSSKKTYTFHLSSQLEVKLEPPVGEAPFQFSNSVLFKFSKSFDHTTFTKNNVTESQIISSLEFQSEEPNNECALFYDYIKQIIANMILNRRKNRIVSRLIDGNNANFTRALSHVDSARKRIIAFSSLAGISEQTHRLIIGLTNGAQITGQLESYLQNANIDSPFWFRPTAQSIVDLRNTYIEGILENATNSTFNSAVKQKISNILRLVSLGRNVYISFRTRPNLIRKTPQEKAIELNVNDLRDFTVENKPAYIALVEAIIGSDHFRVIRTTDPSSRVELDKILNSQFILPIHIAAYIGNVQVVNTLLNANIQVLNNKTIDNNTPLMYAAMSGQQDVVESLVNLGADIAITNRNGKTAAQIALDYGYPDINQYLGAQGRWFRIPSRCVIS